MALLNANIARFYFKSADLPADVFEVARFTGAEGISRLYRFEIDLFSLDSTIDFASVVAKPAMFTMMRGRTPVPIHGEVANFQQMGRTRQHVAYRAVLVPRMWRLVNKYQSHVYQRLTTQEVLTEVLNANGVYDVRFELNEPNGAYAPMEFCVQYRETDFNFVARLMERDGLYYYFEQNEGGETLVITDDHKSLQPIGGGNQLSYHEGDGLVPGEEEMVYSLTCRERAGWPGLVTQKDYNYETPGDYLVDSAAPQEPADAGYGFHYEYGEHIRTAGEASRLASVRSEDLVGRRRAFQGKSTCVGFRSGYHFTLNAHYRQDFNRDHLLIAVDHFGSQRHAMGFDVTADEQSESGVLYANTFTSRPAAMPYRPPRTAQRPEVKGLMVAHIDHPNRTDSQDHGPLDDYAHLDDQGRYRLTVNLDEHREHTPADHSLAVPAMQHYAGPDYGTHFPLHGGVQVMLACVNGDPDRPMVVGTAPNPNQASPVTSANNTQNITRTFAGNELLMEDKQGHTKIALTSAGHHKAVLDDGGRFIGLTSTDGHKLRLHDEGQFVGVLTKGEHGLVLNDGDKGGEFAHAIALGTANEHYIIMSDQDEKIAMRTTGQHRLEMKDAGDGDYGQSILLLTTKENGLLMSDTLRAVGLQTTEGRHLGLSDDEQKVVLSTTGGEDNHTLEMSDAEEYVKLVSREKHGLGIDDQNTEITLFLDGSEGHVVALADGDQGSFIQLQTEDEQYIIIDEEAGIELNSNSKKVVLSSDTEILLKVGETKITIDAMGISIDAPKITSAATGIQEITGSLVKIN